MRVLNLFLCPLTYKLGTRNKFDYQRVYTQVFLFRSMSVFREFGILYPSTRGKHRIMKMALCGLHQQTMGFLYEECRPYHYFFRHGAVSGRND